MARIKDSVESKLVKNRTGMRLYTWSLVIGVLASCDTLNANAERATKSIRCCVSMRKPYIGVVLTALPLANSAGLVSYSSLQLLAVIYIHIVYMVCYLDS